MISSSTWNRQILTSFTGFMLFREVFSYTICLTLPRARRGLKEFRNRLLKFGDELKGRSSVKCSVVPAINYAHESWLSQVKYEEAKFTQQISIRKDFFIKNFHYWLNYSSVKSSRNKADLDGRKNFYDISRADEIINFYHTKNPFLFSTLHRHPARM